MTNFTLTLKSKTKRIIIYFAILLIAIFSFWFFKPKVYIIGIDTQHGIDGLVYYTLQYSINSKAQSVYFHDLKEVNKYIKFLAKENKLIK